MSSKAHFLAEHIDLLPWQANNLCTVEVGGKRITLVRLGEQSMAACAHKCPHAGGVMADGWVTDKQEIVCPLHRYKFSLTTGRNTTGEGYHLRSYRVEQRPDGWYAEIPTSLFGW